MLKVLAYSEDAFLGSTGPRAGRLEETLGEAGLRSRCYDARLIVASLFKTKRPGVMNFKSKIRIWRKLKVEHKHRILIGSYACSEADESPITNRRG